VTSNQVARNVLTAALIAALLYVGYLLREVLLLVVLAVFVAVALSAPVAYLQERLRVPRAFAILLVYVGVLGVLVAIGLLIVPPFVTEFEHLLRAIPRYVRDLEDSALIARWDREYGLIDKLQSQANHLPSLLGDALDELESVTVGVVERIVELIAVLAVAFLLLLDAPRLMDFVYRQLVPDREDQARRIARQSAAAIGGYVGGVFAVALLAGIVAFLMMSLLGIPYAVPLAAQMALFAIIPLVGSPIGAVVIAFVAAFSGPWTMIVWIVFWIVYQQLETHVIGPFVYRRAVDMRPVLVILSVLAGATLLGVLGALLAIPAAATIQILLREWWAARRRARDAAAAVAGAAAGAVAGGASGPPPARPEAAGA
jgi:predicted PurR-regulated permease PerM